MIQAAEFTVIQTPSSLSSKLSTTKNGLEKVELYAEASLWYNALEEALKLTANQKAVSNLLQDLVQSEQPYATRKLTDAERQEIQKRIGNLRQIAINHP